MSMSNKFSIGMVIGLLLLIIAPINLHLHLFPYFDKVAHLCAAGFVTLVLSQYISIRKSVLITFALFTAGESLQILLPNRGASIGDEIANTAGVLIAWGIYKLRLTK